MIVSLQNLADISVASLSMCLSNFKEIAVVETRISRLRDFARSCGKTSYCLVNRGPWVIAVLHKTFHIIVNPIPMKRRLEKKIPLVPTQSCSSALKALTIHCRLKWQKQRLIWYAEVEHTMQFRIQDRNNMTNWCEYCLETNLGQQPYMFISILSVTKLYIMEETMAAILHTSFSAFVWIQVILFDPNFTAICFRGH